MYDDVAVGTTADVAAPIVDIDDTFEGAADPHRGTRADGNSASRLSMVTPPAADDATATAAPVAAALLEPRAVTDGERRNAASAADTGMDIDTDPSPAVIAPPTAEHISPFLLHVRRRAADDAAAPPPDVTGGTADGATATAASAADTGIDDASGASATEAGVAAHEAIGAAAQPAPKRTRKRKYAPAYHGRRQRRRCSDRRDLDGTVRAPDSGGAEAGGDGGSRV